MLCVWEYLICSFACLVPLNSDSEYYGFLRVLYAFIPTNLKPTPLYSPPPVLHWRMYNLSSPRSAPKAGSVIVVLISLKAHTSFDREKLQRNIVGEHYWGKPFGGKAERE